ncbi:hypothetical protein BOX15_Mlig026668g2 [Macrostomum lignano]|uniref:ZP domain-containing protein n=2 Tax=Macrostomum lignano TaxID=282301 RepID=A0A267G236_9PLAT|nr:hypothetical protein BOX15_Mlig026668g2 [Macrostomum lignano]
MLLLLLISTSLLAASPVRAVCHIWQDIVSYSLTKSQTTRGGICHTDKLFQQTGQLMTIAITLYRSDEMSLSYRNSLLHFNATGFADFRGDKLILVIASNAAKRRIELRIEDPAALRVPLEIFHNLHQPDGLSIGSPLPPGQQLTVNRFSRSIAGLNDILSEMGRLRPAAYVGAILVIPYTNAVPEARFSRVAGRYPSPPHVDSEAACQSRSNYKMLQPLLRHFAQVARQPVPVQLFDTRSQMAQPFCRLQPDATIIALHFINGEPLVAMATIIVSLIGSESTLVLLADWGAACPRRLRLRADNSLLAPSTAAGPNASLTVRHNCADDTEIWAESNLLDSVGDRVRIESVPELSLASIRSTGRLLRHFMIQSGRFRNSDSEITFDVQFNQWVFRPMAALQTKRIVSGFTADSALVHLDKSVLNNCTHGLTNLSIGDCPLIDNGTHLHRLLPTVGLLSACRMRRSGNHMLATLSASVQLPSNAGQFLISLPFSWTLPAGISANLPLTEQTRDSRASPTSASSAASAALDKFPFRLTVSQLLLDGHSRAIELQSTRLEYLYSGELIHCELIVRGCGQPVPLVSDGCTRSGALWLGPGVAVPLLRLPSSLPSRVCSGSGTRMAVVACRLAVCRLAEPELAGLTSDEAVAMGMRRCRPQGEACGEAAGRIAARNQSRLVLSRNLPLLSLETEALPLSTLFAGANASVVNHANKHQAATDAPPAVAAEVISSTHATMLAASMTAAQPTAEPRPGTETPRLSQSAAAKPDRPAYQLWSHLLAAVLAFIVGIGTMASLWAIVHRLRWQRRRHRRQLRECRCSSSSNSGGGGGGGCAVAKSSADPLLRLGGGGGGAGGGGHSCDSSSGFGDCGGGGGRAKV